MILHLRLKKEFERRVGISTNQKPVLFLPSKLALESTSPLPLFTLDLFELHGFLQIYFAAHCAVEPVRIMLTDCSRDIFPSLFIQVIYIDIFVLLQYTDLFIIGSFNPAGSYIWFELYGSPSDREVDLIGSVSEYTLSSFLTLMLSNLLMNVLDWGNLKFAFTMSYLYMFSASHL